MLGEIVVTSLSATVGRVSISPFHRDSGDHTERTWEVTHKVMSDPRLNMHEAWTL